MLTDNGFDFRRRVTAGTWTSSSKRFNSQVSVVVTRYLADFSQ